MDCQVFFGIAIRRPDQIAYSYLKNLLESGRVQILGELALRYKAVPIDDPSVDPMLALARLCEAIDTMNQLTSTKPA